MAFRIYRIPCWQGVKISFSRAVRTASTLRLLPSAMLRKSEEYVAIVVAVHWRARANKLSAADESRFCEIKATSICKHNQSVVKDTEKALPFFPRVRSTRAVVASSAGALSRREAHSRHTVAALLPAVHAFQLRIMVRNQRGGSPCY